MGSLQTVIDSIPAIKVILPDSIHTFQNPTKPTLKDYAPLFSIISSLIIAVAGFIVVESRERRKENVRLGKLKTHFLTWVEITKLQIIKQAFEIRMFNNLIKHSALINILMPMRYQNFQWEQILGLDKVDLTEILIIRTKDKFHNKHKLYELSVIKENIEGVLLHMKNQMKENEEMIMTAKRNFIAYHKAYWEFVSKRQFSPELENLLSQLDFNKYSISDFEYVKSISAQIDKLVQEKNLKSEIEKFVDFKFYNKFLLELIQAYENVRYRFNGFEKSILQGAYRLNIIEEYYSGKINNNEYEKAHANPINQKINPDKLYEMISEGSLYRLEKVTSQTTEN